MNFQITNILLLIGALGVVAACTHKSSERPIVMVSIAPQQYLLEQIAGDKIDVRSFLPSDANPETFDPTIAAMRDLSRAKAYIRIGHLPFEETILDRIVESYPELVVYDASQGVKALRGTHGPCSDLHGHATDVDPHLWSSVKNAKVMVANMQQALAKIDPANAHHYATRAELLQHRLERMDSTYATRLAPHRGEAFLVWHPSLSYLARDYGLEQIALGMENKEPTVGHLRSKIEQARQSGARVIFITPEIDGSRASTLVKDIDITPVTISPLSYQWAEEMDKIVDSLCNPQ